MSNIETIKKDIETILGYHFDYDLGDNIVDSLTELFETKLNEVRGEDVRITERGWVGHFIAGDRCRFRRNTLIERGKKRVVVSTVGLMYSDNDEKPEKIGVNRYYETMAFKACKEGAYWEADVTKRVNFESNWALNYYSDSSDNDANDMHEAVVLEITESYLTTKEGE